MFKILKLKKNKSAEQANTSGLTHSHFGEAIRVRFRHHIELREEMIKLKKSKLKKSLIQGQRHNITRLKSGSEADRVRRSTSRISENEQGGLTMGVLSFKGKAEFKNPINGPVMHKESTAGERKTGKGRVQTITH